jgi:hypothetical protein
MSKQGEGERGEEKPKGWDNRIDKGLWEVCDDKKEGDRAVGQDGDETPSRPAGFPSLVGFYSGISLLYVG